MTKTLKNILGLFLVVVSLSVLTYKNIDVRPKELAEIDISRPSTEVVEIVSPVAISVTDINDRIRMAIFNKEFATRLVSYETDTQKLNDVYTIAAEGYFQPPIKGKYNNLGGSIQKLISDITGEDNHVLSQEEKALLSERFMGLAWTLIQKR
jgi:hypothetical protein